MNMLRIIPRLDIKGPNLVKGIHLEGVRVLGPPEAYARYYYDNGADELLYMDAVASLYDRNSLHDIISKTISGIFIPLTVGGGLRTLKDIESVLKAGADRVSVNTQALRTPDFISRAAERFGSSTVAVSIEAKRLDNGAYEAYVENGREVTGIDAVEWAEHAVSLGAGEIIVTSIDREGTGTGYDTVLLKLISEKVSVPVTACGGAGSIEHFKMAVFNGKADALSAASMFHYDAAIKLDMASGGFGGARAFKVDSGTKRIQTHSISNTKRELKDSGMDIRLAL
jgi:cyclase